MKFIEAIKNKFRETKDKIKKRKVISHATDALVEVGDCPSLDDAIFHVGYHCDYSPGETADFVIMLEDYIGSDLLLWQKNKTTDDCEDLLRNFIHHL